MPEVATRSFRYRLSCMLAISSACNSHQLGLSKLSRDVSQLLSVLDHQSMRPQESEAVSVRSPKQESGHASKLLQETYLISLVIQIT